MKNLKEKTKESTPVGGMTYEQIGKELGISKQGVRRIEKRAIKKLRRAYLKLCGFDKVSVKEAFLYDFWDE